MPGGGTELPPRQRMIVKKPPLAPAPKAGTNAKAKSRLAAAKVALKAKQQAAEAKKAAGSTEANPSIQVSEAPTVTQATDTIVFNGGFFDYQLGLYKGRMCQISCLYHQLNYH